MSMRGSIVLVVTLAAASVAGVASAESPCRADVEKLCPDAAATAGGLQACVRSNEAKLSEACKRQLEKVKGRVGPLLPACRYDITLLCSDVAPGDGRIRECIQAKREQVTPECTARVDGLKAH